MPDSDGRRTIEVSSPLVPRSEPISLAVGPDDTVVDVLAQIENDRTGVLTLPDHTANDWTGDVSGDHWTLREDRQIEEGTWWTEAEVEAFKDRESPTKSELSSQRFAIRQTLCPLVFRSPSYRLVRPLSA